LAKAPLGSGNLLGDYLVHRTVIRAALGLVLLRSAAAWACPPTVRLDGDPDLTKAIAASLIERGISTDGSGCPATQIAVARRAGTIVVSNATADSSQTQRVVSDVRTAATVIESWVRTDVEAPLLPGLRVVEESSTAPATAPTPTVAVTSSPPPQLGVRAFTSAEASLGSDRTSWVGAEVGACVMLGAVCAAARVRFASVVDGPGQWQGLWDRHAVEVLLGADWPLRRRALTFAPGAAAGAGWTHTHEEGMSGGAQTAGLRLEAHLTVSYPVGQRLALESTIAFEFMQALDVDASSATPLPGDTRLLGHLGVGVRFGGP
jgi:hypothetical protein